LALVENYLSGLKNSENTEGVWFSDKMQIHSFLLASLVYLEECMVHFSVSPKNEPPPPFFTNTASKKLVLYFVVKIRINGTLRI
jgi:hypothetical protein